MLSNLSNKAGVKYPIKDNVTNLFTRMIGEGKATIRYQKCIQKFAYLETLTVTRFIEPAHDLCIQCQDVVQLKSFLILVEIISKSFVMVALWLISSGEEVYGGERPEQASTERPPTCEHKPD